MAFTLAQLQHISKTYDHVPLSPSPWSLHPTLQLIPILGNILVFIQTAQFIHRVNQIALVPYRDRLEIWASAIIILLVGMVPVVGFLLTKWCCLCTDYVYIASHCVKLQHGYGLDIRQYGSKYELEVIPSRHSTIFMTPLNSRPGSINEESLASRDTVVDIQPPKNVFRDDPRWMQDVMAISPNNDTSNRVSLSNQQRHRSRTMYTSLRELANTRTSHMALSHPTDGIGRWGDRDTMLVNNNDPLRISFTRRMTKSLSIAR